MRVCIRPERVMLGNYVLQGSRGNDLPGVVDRVVYMGPMLHVLIEVDGIGSIQAVIPNQGASSLQRGDRDSRRHAGRRAEGVGRVGKLTRTPQISNRPRAATADSESPSCRP